VTCLDNIASAATGALATAAKMSRGATAIYICICIHTYIYIHLFEYLKMTPSYMYLRHTIVKVLSALGVCVRGFSYRFESIIRGQPGFLRRGAIDVEQNMTQITFVRVRTPIHCNKLQHTATHRNTLQHSVTRCNTLQHITTHCNALTSFRRELLLCETLTPQFDTCMHNCEYVRVGWCGMCVCMCVCVCVCVWVCEGATQKRQTLLNQSMMHSFYIHVYVFVCVCVGGGGYFF